MSALRYGVQCVPAGQVMLPGIPGMVTPEPTHVGCPGGEHQPGVIGGWTCPCDCHRRPPVSVPEPECQCGHERAYHEQYGCVAWAGEGECSCARFAPAVSVVEPQPEAKED